MLVLITQFLLWPIVRASEASWKPYWPHFLLCCVMVCPLWSREMNFPSYLTVTAWLLIQWSPTFIDVAINGSCFAPVLLVGSLLDNQEGTEIPSSLEVFLQSKLSLFSEWLKCLAQTTRQLCISFSNVEQTLRALGCLAVHIYKAPPLKPLRMNFFIQLRIFT